MNTDVIRRDLVGLVIDGNFTLVQKLGGSEQGCRSTFVNSAEDRSRRRPPIKLISRRTG